MNQTDLSISINDLNKKLSRNVSMYLCPGLRDEKRNKIKSGKFTKTVRDMGIIIFPTTQLSDIKKIYYDTYEKDIYTTRLYQYSLFWFAPLLSEYKNNEKDYKLKDIIIENFEDFILFISDDFSKLDKIRAYEHSAAMRLVNICNYMQFFDIDDSKLKIIIDYINHLIKLLITALDKIRNNHGVMIIMALLHLNLILDNDSNINKEINSFCQKELIKLYDDIFYESGFARENSTGYHIFNLRCFNEIDEFCAKFNTRIDLSMLSDKLKKSNEISNCIIYQDGTVPTIGDTPNYFYKNTSINQSSCFSDAGLAIIKDDDIFLSLKSGMGFRAHKHVDDCSILLRYKNIDIFYDCGQYNYDTDDPIKQLIASPRGHSGIYPGGIKELQPSKYIRNYFFLGGISSFNKHEDGEHLNSYLIFKNGFSALRNIVYKDKQIGITDLFVNPLKDTEVRFCLNKNSTISFIGEERDGFKIDIDDLSILITFESQNNFDIIHEKGFYSKIVGVSEEIPCLVVKFNNYEYGSLTTNIIIE